MDIIHALATPTNHGQGTVTVEAFRVDLSNGKPVAGVVHQVVCLQLPTGDLPHYHRRLAPCWMWECPGVPVLPPHGMKLHETQWCQP